MTITLVSLTIVWMLAFFFAFLFICKDDPAAYWASTTVTQERCVNTVLLYDFFAITDAIGDFVIIVIPIPQVR